MAAREQGVNKIDVYVRLAKGVQTRIEGLVAGREADDGHLAPREADSLFEKKGDGLIRVGEDESNDGDFLAILYADPKTIDIPCLKKLQDGSERPRSVVQHDGELRDGLTGLLYCGVEHGRRR